MVLSVAIYGIQPTAPGVYSHNWRKMPGMKNYTVKGMTCGHCVMSVKEEVGALDGVTGVDVDLASGALRVEGTVTDAAVRGAVEEAGYQLV